MSGLCKRGLHPRADRYPCGATGHCRACAVAKQRAYRCRLKAQGRARLAGALARVQKGSH